MTQYRIAVPSVYDNFHILTTALQAVVNPTNQNCTVAVIEDAFSPDWNFNIGCGSRRIAATFPTVARMATPDRQIAAIRGGLECLIRSMAGSETQ